MMRNSGRAPPSAPSSIRTTTPPAEVSRLARARDTLGGPGIEVGSAFNELAHDRIGGVLDLVDGADGSHLTVIEHGDARPDAIGAAHVVRDDDARDAESLAHPDHELVDHGAGDRIEASGRFVIEQVF